MGFKLIEQIIQEIPELDKSIEMHVHPLESEHPKERILLLERTHCGHSWEISLERQVQTR